MLFEPNAIDRVVAADELNMPVVKSKPLSTSAPLVNVTVLLVTRVGASPNVVVPEVLLIINPDNVLPLLVIVPVPNMVGVTAVNVPPLDNVKLPAMFNDVVPGLNAVEPKSRLSNQLPVVNVAIAVPLPVNVKLGAFVADPPVVPNTYVLVTDASDTNPPVPVYVNPVAVAKLNTVCAAVVCANTILFVPNVIARAAVPVEANIPVVKSNPFKFKVPLVNVVVRVTPVLNALPKLHAPATPSNVTGAFIVTPLVVMVLPLDIELNVMTPVAFQTVPASNNIEPELVRVPVEVNVTGPPLVVILPQTKAPVNVTL